MPSMQKELDELVPLAFERVLKDRTTKKEALGHAATCDEFEISMILSSPFGQNQHPGARGL